MTNRKEFRQRIKSDQFRTGRFGCLGAMFLIVLGVGVVGLGIPRHTVANPEVAATIRPPSFTPIGSDVTATPQPLGLGPGTIYIVDGGDVVHKPSRILALDPQTGEVRAEFLARYKPALTFSPDGRTLYVVDTFATRMVRGDPVHALTAIDTETGLVAWEIDLPGERQPYMGDSATGVWTSADGRRIYVLMGEVQDKPDPRLVVVDTDTHQVVKEISIALPYDSRWHWPRFWKPAWSEELVVVSWEQLFTVDLSTGERGKMITLPGFDDRSRIPENLSQWVEVEGGDIAAQARRLYLATSTQDILVVELDDPTMVQRVFTLPSRWEFGLMKPVVVSEDGRFMYLGVRRIASPIHSARLAEEVWSYDTTTWKQVGTVRPSGGDDLKSQDQGVFGMALSPDGQGLYTVNPWTSALSIIDIQTMREVKVVRNIGQPVNFRPAPGWILLP